METDLSVKEKTAKARVNLMRDKASEGTGMDKCYDDWAEHFDDDNIFIKHAGYESVIQAVDKYYKDNRHIKILDVGSGTGYAGVKLTERGFTHIEGVDPSAESLKVAKRKNVYKRLIHHLVGPMPIPLSDETYDCIIGAGVLGPNHLGSDSLPELYRLLKKGGLLMIQGNNHYWTTIPDYNVMEKELGRMVKENIMEKVEWNVFPNYVTYEKEVQHGLLIIYKRVG